MRVHALSGAKMSIQVMSIQYRHFNVDRDSPCDVAEVKNIFGVRTIRRLEPGEVPQPSRSPVRLLLRWFRLLTPGMLLFFLRKSRSKHPHCFILHCPRVSGAASLCGASFLRYLGGRLKLTQSRSELMINATSINYMMP